MRIPEQRAARVSPCKPERRNSESTLTTKTTHWSVTPVLAAGCVSSNASASSAQAEKRRITKTSM
eukprot:CAMPEP_0183376838 /NCGR_PEP_ID=MMETSP0164_2-20130417/121442_1 /TAXON_ID=221442 /ORGANISM="Coccolithus pelagicus ssp braarudi, Strain PLY182g" /LENGTH=64 /DNA_ID=CAMNT_0025554223 /DNA_START=53 /DNA_END=244 /DNA_ORIENTATION=+